MRYDASGAGSSAGDRVAIRQREVQPNFALRQRFVLGDAREPLAVARGRGDALARRSRATRRAAPWPGACRAARAAATSVGRPGLGRVGEQREAVGQPAHAARGCATSSRSRRSVQSRMHDLRRSTNTAPAAAMRNDLAVRPVELPDRFTSISVMIVLASLHGGGLAARRQFRDAHAVVAADDDDFAARDQPLARRAARPARPAIGPCR